MLGLALIGLASIALAEDKPTSMPKVLRVGYFGAVNSQLLAKNLGLDSREVGIPVEWVKLDSGRDLVTALAAGGIDIGEIGFPPTVTAIAAGVSLEGIFISHLSGSGVALVVRAEKNVHGLKSLIGKKVGVPFGTNPHYLLITALRLEGIDPKLVKLVDLSPSELLAAYMRGDIDAGYVWQPTLGKLIDAGAKIILTSEDMAKKGYPTGDIEVVRKGFADKYPELVTKFARGESHAAELWLAEPSKAADIVSKELSVSTQLATQLMTANRVLSAREQLRPAYLGTTTKKGEIVQSLKAVADFLVQEGRLKSAPDERVFMEFINPGYLERANENRR